MLDIGGANSLPPTIVVGRTLSAYDVPDVQNNQETLTFTVYNQAADPITGVLLTDTLENGVTFASASQLPDQNGQELAWSLGTIQPYDRASVTLTVSLASPTPTTLDTGASTYGTLDAGMVTWTTAPATLRTTAIAAALLASTPDANTTDPYVQEKVAELNYDPTQIYSFLQTQIGYNSYVGSLRGARGTLWSSAGNSLDDASLGVALMRASGIPAQYEVGTLTTAQAQQLILSMFPASYQTVGYIPTGTQTSDPANDPQLLSETKDHFWFQFDAGNGMKDADPEFAGQATGQAATASTNSFTDVPQSLRQTTEVSLTAETYNQAVGAFAPGVSPFTETVVLDQTFNDVDLVGVPVSLGNFISAQGFTGSLTHATFTYSPYVELGDGSTPGSDTIIRGTDYQETYNSFPFGSDVLTGLFLNVSFQSAEVNGQRQTTTENKTLFDRIGFAQRQAAGPVSLNLPSTPEAALSALDIVTLEISGETEDDHEVGFQMTLSRQLATQNIGLAQSVVQGGPAPGGASLNQLNSLTSQVVTETNVLLGQTFLADSDLASAGIASPLFTTAYYDSPRVVAVSSSLSFNESATQAALNYNLDILADTPDVVVAPNQSNTMIVAFHFMHGISDSVIEGHVMNALPSNGGAQSLSAMGVVLGSLASGSNLVVLSGASDTSKLSALQISAESKARISAALSAGLAVIVPASPVVIDGSPRTAWIQVNTVTGDAVAVADDGTHGASEQSAAYALADELVDAAVAAGTKEAGIEAGQIAGDDLVELVVNDARAANAGLEKQAMKDAVREAVSDFAQYFGKQAVAHLSSSSDVIVPLLDSFWKYVDESLKVVQADPPLDGFTANPTAPISRMATVTSDPTPDLAASGVVEGADDVVAMQADGDLRATWTASATSTADVQSVSVSAGAVVADGGEALGTGTVTLSTTEPVQVSVSGQGQYQISGRGFLSLYSQAEQTLGVGGDWSDYLATVTGNLVITLTVPGDVLSLNGQNLPAGTYSINANSASLSGSGTTTTPTFAGTASITATTGAVELGPGSGNLNVGGDPLNTADETTLTGYNGTISVSANGTDSEAVTLSGNTANLLTLAPSVATLTTNQNRAVLFNAGVQTSFADTYNLTANAPTGWTVTIDATGKVTVTPTPGTQSGTYPIQVIAQSTTNPDLVSQATVEVTVTSTMPGMTLAVKPDPLFTAPFDGAQVPSAFQATIQNTGPLPDTYNVTFANVPSGWTIVDSGTSVTVPAGETGILGVYLQPTGTSLPPPGTNLSFTVTATSATNSAITQTVDVTFVMPAIAAATVTSDPVELSTTPGTATTATITITNVGNVPYNAALATTTDSGLAISGLPSPGTIAVGQSVTETATLTPDASTPLNSTLNATVNVDQAATQNGVSVVEVNASTAGAAVPQNGTGQEVHPPGFAVAGQSVDVMADVQSEVSQSEQGEASFTVTDAQGNTVFSSTAVPITLDTIGALATVDLGTFDTTGFAPGEYTINVSIAQSGSPPVPIAGATGSTTLTVGLPVSASVSVDSDNQTPGPVTSTETLNVTSNAVMGNVAIDSTATSVAVSPGAPGLAYVAGTQDISVVDISNPISPKVLGTFGSKDISQGGFNLVQVANGELIVASQPPSAGSEIALLVYSLANPQAPALLGSASVPYNYLNGMTIEGTTAYLSTYGQTYDANGDVLSQTGELVAVDFSNPATPVIGGALYNDQPQPAGHASFVNESAAVNPQTLLVTGSTSTGASTQTGTGTVTVVNTGAGGTLSTGATLTIPATVDAVGIAIDGTHALVVGSTGGLVSPFSDPSQVGLSGNVTLTLLDITNPASPTVIGSTVITQNTFQPVGQFPLSALNVIDLGNGQFAINGTLSNGSPTLLLVDASNPNSLATSNMSTNANAAGLTLADGQLFGAAADGLTIYQAAALTTTPTTVTVTVPTNGVSIVPNSFSLAPTSTSNGTNSETLTWTLNLAPGANQQITWQTNVADLQAEQVQPVVTAATVEFTSPGSPPRSVGATLGGATLNLAGVPTPISVTIPVEVAAPGVPAIENAAVAAQNLNIPGLPQQLNDLGLALTNLVETPTSNVYLSQATAALASLITLVTNDPFLSGYAAGLTTAQTELSSATTPTQIQTAITNLGTALDSLAQAITDYALHGFTLSLASSQALALPGAPTLYNVLLQNTGSQTTTYDFSVSGLPTGVTATFSPTSITLAPGASIPQGTTTVTLNLTQSGTALVGGNFTVTATAEGASEITLDTPGQLTLLAESLTVPVVTVTPPFTQPGGMVDVTAKIETVVNEPHTLSASFTVSDPNGNVIYTDANPQTVPLTDTSGLTTVDLGNIDTTGFADGVDTVTVTVTDSSSPPSVPATLPTATAQGNLTIGLPVSASVSTNPPLLPENTVPSGLLNVTTTLSVDAETPFPDPLTLEALSPSTIGATDVALYPAAGTTYAYVSGGNGIDVVDVTNPAAPIDDGVFGTSDIVKGGFTKGVVDNIGGTEYLIVGTTATLNANQFTLLFYSLTNPAAPTLVSKTAFDYEFMNDLVIDGPTLLVPTSGLYFFAGGLEGEYGTLLSIDISNPAAPTLNGALYNNPGPPEAGDTLQFGGLVVKPGLAYIASSTSTSSADSINPGVGRLLVVDDTNPAQLSVSKEVDIPGTFQAIDVAIQGSQALVVSSTGGPAGDLSNFGEVSGHLALSLMDVSDPTNPQLIGTTLITADNFATSVQNGGAVSVLSLGNGLYAVSGAISGGKPVLLLVDPTDPNNITVSATTMPVLGNEMAVSGDILYATSSQGLTTYQIGSIAHTSYTASVEVPTDANTSIVSGSFNIPPTSITTGTNFDTLTWVRQLAFGQDQPTFTWQTQVADLAANEVRPVTLGTSLSFVSQSTPGSFTLPGTSVTGEPVIEVLPTSATIPPGGTATFDVRLSNPLNQTVDYYLQSIIGSNFTNNVPLKVTMQPNSTVDLPFQVTAKINDAASTWQEYIILRGSLPPSDEAGSGESGEAPFTVTIAGTPVIPTPDAHGVAINLTPAKASAGPDGIAQYTVQVTNTGSVEDSFGLGISGPGALNASFQLPSDSLFNEFKIPPGASRDVTLTLAPAAFTTSPGDYPFTVTATAAYVTPPPSAAASGTLTVLGPGVYVNLQPTTASTAPGAPYQVTVLNVGTTSDTFNLSLAGPAAQIASLAATQTMTLAPGNSQRIDITTSAAAFADAGKLPLTVVATSQANPAAQGASTAILTVPSTQSVSASFSPPTQNLAAPGATSFLLQVNNTGNTEDQYSATITGTTGAITASLIGLDGLPAQSVPLFILPGLAQGAILLDVSGGSPGQGTVTVTIQSLTNSSENTTATATLNVASPVQMQLALSADSGITPVEGSTTTIASSVLDASVVGATVAASGIVYTVTSLPTNGTLLLNGQALAAGGTFTQDDINNGRLIYQTTEEGADSFAFSVASTNALGTTGTLQIAASDAPLTISGGFSYTATEGAAGTSQAVATFSDTGGPEALADYAATINWDDGTSATAGTLAVDANTGIFTVSGAHTYAGDGTFGVTVTVTHETAPAVTATSAADIGATAVPVLTLVNDKPIATTEGSSVILTNSLLETTDSDTSVSASTILYTITAAPTLGTLADDGVSLTTGGTFSQQDINNGIVTYHSTEDGADSFAFSVAAGTAAPISGTLAITAADAPLTITGGFTYAATEGAAGTAQTVATFSDTGGPESLSDYAATINWGDGSSASPGTLAVDANTGIFTVSGAHTYAGDGTFGVTVTVTHETAPAVTATSAADISATAVPVLTLVNDKPIATREGSSVILTNSLLETTDSDTSVSASTILYTIAAAPTFGTLADHGVLLTTGGTFSQQDIKDGIVTYHSTEEGNDSFAFSVAAGTAAPITGTLAITAVDAPLTITGGFTYTATEGAAGTAQTVAAFSDTGGPEALSDYAATINWGDGASATAGTLAVDANTGVFTVSGSHTYANGGTFGVTVTVTHETAPAVTATSSAAISAATITSQGGIAATALAVTGYEFSPPTTVAVATFTDGDGSLPAGDFRATIDWGDGATSTGSVSAAAAGAGGTPAPQYTVGGAHEYLDEGQYTVRVSIEQTAGPVAGVTTATVSARATIHEQLVPNGTVGSHDQNYIQEIYRDVFGRQADPGGLEFWVDELTRGTPRSEVAYQMVQLAYPEEFQRDTVKSLYQQYLGRAADPAGMQFWTAYLYDGGTIEGMAQALVGSLEYFQVRGQATDAGFLGALFHDALGRGIGSADLTYFEGLMANGMSASDVAAILFNSDEYHRLRVDALFEQFLGRPADADALRYFGGELDGGATDELVISQLISSDEYFEKSQV